MRVNKYIYMRVLQGFYAQGWEDLCAADETRDGLREIQSRLEDYRKNEGGRYRVIHRREPNPTYKEPQFFNADGSLSAYSFACGKVQQSEILQVKMWKEHFCYHILRHAATGIIHTETDSLVQARKTYNAYIRDAKKERKS